jgi:polar amino acid transport system permease protein
MIRPLNPNDFVYILLALRWTVLLSLAAIAGGGLLGFLVLSLRMTRGRVLHWLAVAYIQFFQATPLLMQIFLVFFGATLVGLRLDPWPAAVIAFSLHASAFLADIWFASVLAVPKAQWEGARSLALPNRLMLRLVIAPQAARIAVAPTIGFLVQLIKATSLASIIGFVEVVRAGQFITNSTLQPLYVYGFVACLYFALCWPLSKFSQGVEARLNRGFQRA